MRRFLRAAAPPALLAVYRRLAFGEHLGCIWRGVYSDFSTVPVKGDGFGSPEWLDALERYAQLIEARGRSGATIPSDVSGRHMLLPLAVSCLAAGKSRLTVLDFGGGLATDYMLLRHACPGADVEFHVVESAAVAALGSRHFAASDPVHFHQRIPTSLPRVDLLHISTSLQFVDDYQGVLRALGEVRPAHILMVDLPAGDIPTFASAQVNVRGSVLPAWFFNVRELIGFVESLGYALTFKAASDQRIDLPNLPASHRISHSCHLLFKRV